MHRLLPCHPLSLPAPPIARPQDALWRQQSHRTLPALMGATDMLVRGADWMHGCVRLVGIGCLFVNEARPLHH